MGFTETISRILQIIGFVTVCVGAYHYIYIPYLKAKQEKKQQFNFKVAILLLRHPAIKSMFNKFKADEISYVNSINKRGKEDAEYNERGELLFSEQSLISYRIFGIAVMASSDYSIEEFHKIVVEKVQELEKDPQEKQVIAAIVKNEKVLTNLIV